MSTRSDAVSHVRRPYSHNINAPHHLSMQLEQGQDAAAGELVPGLVPWDVAIAALHLVLGDQILAGNHVWLELALQYTTTGVGSAVLYILTYVSLRGMHACRHWQTGWITLGMAMAQAGVMRG